MQKSHLTIFNINDDLKKKKTTNGNGQKLPKFHKGYLF